jgi:hypothetical protein
MVSYTVKVPYNETPFGTDHSLTLNGADVIWNVVIWSVKLVKN